MSPTLHRINIDQWRSSVPNTTESLTVPPLVGGRFPSHARPLPPPNPADFNNLNLLHHSTSNSTSNRPSLLNLTSSSSDEEVESRSGSEMVSERSGKKEEADRLVDSTLELLLSVWPSAPSSLAALTPPVSITSSSSDSGTADSDQDAVPLRTFVNEILRRSRSSCATLRAARLYLERAATLLPPGQERKSTLACPRRTFLSSLILANKFLHDRVYSNRAWGKVSGLQVREISQGETALGDLLGWALWVGREPGTFDPAVDLKLGANAPALIPIPDYYETSVLTWKEAQSYRLKRGRSASSSNVFLGRSDSASEPTSSVLHSATKTTTASKSISSWGRTTSLPSITLNGTDGGDSDAIFFTSASWDSSAVGAASLPVAPLPRVRSVFTTVPSFMELSSSLSSRGASSVVEEESSESEVESEMGTVEDENEHPHPHHSHQMVGEPMRKRQRVRSVEVVDGAQASQLEREVGWALGLGRGVDGERFGLEGRSEELFALLA